MSIHQIIKQRLSSRCLIRSQTFSSDAIRRLTYDFAKTMDLIRSDESAACNAISVALLHVFVDRVDGWMGGWVAFCWQVKWILRGSALLFCLASDRSARGATGRHAPCLSPSTKLTYSRLSAQILLHCRRCQRTPLWPPLHTVSPRCINGSLIAGPYRHLAVLLLPLAAHCQNIHDVAQN